MAARTRKTLQNSAVALQQVQTDLHNGKLQAITISKTRGTLIVAVFMIAAISMLHSKFYGVVAARLPYVPFAMFANMSHYGIENPDMTLASVSFIFVLSNMTVGAYIRKFLALEGKRVAGPPIPKWLQQQ